jgi:chromosome partitioning protein
VGRVIAVTNQKGGVGKTTTAINLSACLAMSDQRVLMIDLDPQGNASTGSGCAVSANGNSIYRVLMEDQPLHETVQQTEIQNFSVVPSNMDLYGAEVELVSLDRREERLRNSLNGVREAYDFILIDCPPSLNMLTLNCLTAADTVIIPLQTEFYALEGLAQLLRTIDLIRGSTNPSLKIEGILFTMCDQRTLLSNQVMAEVAEHFPDLVFKTVIPRNVRLSEAPSHGKPIILYDCRSKGADAYVDLAKELIEKCREKSSVKV